MLLEQRDVRVSNYWLRTVIRQIHYNLCLEISFLALPMGSWFLLFALVSTELRKSRAHAAVPEW